MFTPNTKKIFPDVCEVYQVEKDVGIYPIFKSGSTSLKSWANKKKHKKLINDQIKRLKLIKIFLREPYERFCSGVNSFLQWTKNENNKLDDETILFFVKKYPFLDRHFCPQFLRLINLTKFYQGTIKIYLLDELNKHVDDTHMRPDNIEPMSNKLPLLLEEFKNDKYLMLDNFLIENYKNKTTSFKEIIKEYKNQNLELYNQLFHNDLKILGELDVLSKN